MAEKDHPDQFVFFCSTANANSVRHWLKYRINKEKSVI